MLKVSRRNVNCLWKNILTPFKLAIKSIENARFMVLTLQVIMWTKLLVTFGQDKRKLSRNNQLSLMGICYIKLDGGSSVIGKSN